MHCFSFTIVRRLRTQDLDGSVLCRSFNDGYGRHRFCIDIARTNYRSCLVGSQTVTQTPEWITFTILPSCFSGTLMMLTSRVSRFIQDIGREIQNVDTTLPGVRAPNSISNLTNSCTSPILFTNFRKLKYPAENIERGESGNRSHLILEHSLSPLFSPCRMAFAPTLIPVSLFVRKSDEETCILLWVHITASHRRRSTKTR